MATRAYMSVGSSSGVTHSVMTVERTRPARFGWRLCEGEGEGEATMKRRNSPKAEKKGS